LTPEGTVGDPQRESNELAQRMQRVELLTQQLERCPDPAARAASQELVAVLLQMHGAGLAKMLALLSGSGCREILAAFASDELIASLLLLHGLHPESLEVRVRRALERAGGHLAAHRAGVELLAIDEGLVRLRVQAGSLSPATLRQTIQEEIFEAAPDVLAVEIEGLPPEGPAGRLFSLPLLGGSER
jgi:hypothetical protein